jgi:site-specific DNA recombinase
VLLVDAFPRAGVEVMFLNREWGQTPEDEWRLQVQGMLAEDERAKILERHRRGKRHAAHAGSVNVLVAAPYGSTFPSTPVAGKPAVRAWRTKRGSCASCSTGSATSASRAALCVAA